jgi:predicted RNase H-like HicB family nuclease
MNDHIYHITAFWDDEADVWVAESDDVPGLVAEAASIEILVEKLKVLIPELLELNNVLPHTKEIAFEVISKRHVTVCVPT